MRVAFVSTVYPVVAALDEWFRAHGHEPVALITARRPGAPPRPDGLDLTDQAVPRGLDLLYAKDKFSIEPLLRAYEPDLMVCWGFPWKIPKEALDVPRLGSVNMHPAFLPRHRGPLPLAWSFREGLGYVGATWHRMDAELDTGGILAQTKIEVPDDLGHILELGPLLIPAVLGMLPRVLERVEAGDPGDAQDDSQATWAGYFEPEYAQVDTSKTAREVHNQVRAWTFTFGLHDFPAPLLDGERILRTSLTDQPGARRLECTDAPVWIIESEPA